MYMGTKYSYLPNEIIIGKMNTFISHHVRIHIYVRDIHRWAISLVIGSKELENSLIFVRLQRNSKLSCGRL